MVNLQFCNESAKVHSTKLSAASCSDEVSQASIKSNGSSHHSSKVPVVNGDCKVSLEDTPLVNGSCSKMPANGFPTMVGYCNKLTAVKNGPIVNGKCCNVPINDLEMDNRNHDKIAVELPMVNRNHHDKAAPEEFPLVNGNHHDKVPVEEFPTVNGNHQDKVAVEEFPTVNGNHQDKVAVEEFPTVNGNHRDKVAVVEFPMVNGNHGKAAVEEFPTVNGNHGKAAVEEFPTVNGNHGKAAFEEFPTMNENRGKAAVEELSACGPYNKDINDSSIPTENGTVQNDSNENSNGFVTVVNKKKLNRNKNRNKPISNLPPIKKTENIRRDNGIDKNHNVKSSPSHLAQKPPSRTVFPVRSSEKSYSSALASGQPVMSQMKNASLIFLDSPNKAFSDVTKGSKVNKSSNNNHDLSKACKAIAKQLSAVTNDTLTISYQPNSATKVEKTDFSGQTDICPENELSRSQTKCLPSQEDTFEESVKASSPIYCIDVDYVKEITDESNIAYCDSVVDTQGAVGPLVILDNVEWYGAVGSDVFLPNISDDSGRGDSVYCDGTFRCQFPKVKVPLLIGRHGNYKKEVEGRSGAKIRVINLYNKDADFAIVEIKGQLPQIEKAKEIIQERFPDVLLQYYFGVAGSESISPYYIATLPEGTNFPGVVSSMYSPSRFWVQQYGHPLFYHLEDLERRMSMHFNAIPNAPIVEYPVPGQIVAVAGSTNSNNEAKWLRGMITNIFPDEGNVVINYLDHGGEYLIPVTAIRQMRHEFFTMPFFAAECSLYGVQPVGEDWSPEAFQEFARLCYVSRHPTLKVVEKTPYCYLVSMETYDCSISTIVDFATVLIEKGFAVPYTDCRMYQLPDALEQ
ncbi:KH domain-containing protein akap-1-like isoform X2 [Argiope bruennichi]|uniref:KH domain-containing protein akap-1-like isoform X2 n=1 Tax=Argiope bruennichi TaxID=94029 RepID=UPI0024957B7B|nr:KH domain-containing protein akap-1-like isoform X2 [Argiope bruennichi]